MPGRRQLYLRQWILPLSLLLYPLFIVYLQFNHTMIAILALLLTPIVEETLKYKIINDCKNKMLFALVCGLLYGFWEIILKIVFVKEVNQFSSCLYIAIFTVPIMHAATCMLSAYRSYFYAGSMKVLYASVLIHWSYNSYRYWSANIGFMYYFIFDTLFLSCMIYFFTRKFT